MSAATVDLEQIIAERRAARADRWDEVWDGVYQLMPLPNNEHQGIVGRFDRVLGTVVEDQKLGRVFPGANITDQEADWTCNYRCPDVAVFLNGTGAEDRHTHWFGGPDFAVEVVSEHDRSREKLEFYARVATRELLLVDRAPWSLELYRLGPEGLGLVGRSTIADPVVLTSAVVPLSFALAPGEGDERPQVVATHADGAPTWRI